MIWIERDARVAALHEELLEIEQRLIPTSLHVFGQAAELKEKADLLCAVAAFDRPELGTRSLPALVAQAVGLDVDAAETGRTETTELINGIVSQAVQQFCDRGPEAAATWLNSEAGVEPSKALPTFRLLAQISERLDLNHEIAALMAALRGEYIEPGPGADIVQNPLVLPTGRNTHAVNPYSVPSRTAVVRGSVTAQALLDRYVAEHGRYPRALALVLWGLDNIKTQGEGVAQALWLLGTRPVRDALNRTTNIEAIPLAQLGRPRIDVVMTVSGIFRDLFSPTVQLLDKAVRLVAQLDEPVESNYVRKHVLEQTSAEVCTPDEAA